MGRGRQKAKDAKIARQIKYTPMGMDIRALERELVGGHPGEVSAPVGASPVEDDDMAEVESADDYADAWDDDER